MTEKRRQKNRRERNEVDGREERTRRRRKWRKEKREREKERRKITERREIHLEEKPRTLMGPWAELYTVRNLRQDTIPKILMSILS